MFFAEQRIRKYVTCERTARAMGKGKSDIGEQSEDSNPQIIAKARKVTELSLSADGTAAWTATNGTGYDLRLYKGSAVAAMKTDAESGCNLLTDMRDNGAGDYAITVSAKSDTGLALNADESQASGTVTVAHLQTARPAWSGAVLGWQPDDKAAGYEIVLYKDGNVLDTLNIDAGTTSYDFKSMMEQYPMGTFDATVQAIGSGAYLSSKVSSHSLAVIAPPGLAQVGKPSFSSAGIVNWANVANADKYMVQLIRDGIALGEAKTAVNGETGLDLLSAMRDAGAGCYTVTVMSEGDDEYQDGQQSEASDAQVVAKAEKVTGVNLSSEGLVTWNETNGKSYELTIYKNGSAVDTVEEAEQGFCCHDAINANGAGKYTATVTAKSDSGLLIDSDKSEASNVQAAGAVQIRSGSVENAFKPVLSVDKSSNGIIITYVEPNSGLKDGKTKKFTIDLEYSLVSMDDATIMICSNFDTGFSNSKNYIQVTEYNISKGCGSLRFVINIVPKAWSNGDPFFIAGELVDNDSVFYNTPEFCLSFQ